VSINQRIAFLVLCALGVAFAVHAGIRDGILRRDLEVRGVRLHGSHALVVGIVGSLVAIGMLVLVTYYLLLWERLAL